MSKQSVRKQKASPDQRGEAYGQLVAAITDLHSQMVARAASAANQALVLRNWLVGAYIVEFEQHGADRAAYGARLLETLARDLKAKGARGLGLTTLKLCRLFVRSYPQIGQTQIGQTHIGQTLSDQFHITLPQPAIGQTASDESEPAGDEPPEQTQNPPLLSPEDALCFSWSQLQELVRIDDPWKRAFYETECLRGHWSVRQLQRQIESMLYERTGLSTRKEAVIKQAHGQVPREGITEVLRDPYILEFTGLAERPEYSEDDLESALLDHVQRFLLELGRGFCFEARQFRMTEGRKHHRVDLVFYHRLLRCHVLIDLKVRAFQPADAGQMNFYVNWFKANMKAEGDNEPFGILLCSDRDGAEVEFATAGMDQQLFVSRYLTALPSVEELKAFMEADRAQIRARTEGTD